jgi:hypothetical protein
MSMASGETALRDYVAARATERWLWDRGRSVCLTDLHSGTTLGAGLPSLAGRSVLVAAENQLNAALALIELDGIARRVVILPPGVEFGHLAEIIAASQVDAAVIDSGSPSLTTLGLPIQVSCEPSIIRTTEDPANRISTEWVLVTSGTTGVPKMVVHNLASLTAPLQAPSRHRVGDFLRHSPLRRPANLSSRASRRRLTCTVKSRGERRRPSREAGAARDDPSIWDAVALAASADEPGHRKNCAALCQVIRRNRRSSASRRFARDDVEMKIVDGSLRIRSPRTASAYLGAAPPLAAADGFVDTGDIVEQHGDRCFFAGRKGGIINIGGMKVHPEEVEAVINRHPRVRMSLVRGRQSPITGSVVVADVVLSSGQNLEGKRQIEVKNDILKFCSNALPRHKVPASISFVPKLDVAATGKLVRRQG